MFKELVRRIRQDFATKRDWAIIWHRVKCFGLCLGIMMGMIFLIVYTISLLPLLPISPVIIVPSFALLSLLLLAGTVYLVVKIIEVSVDQEDDILYPKWKDY